jgi:glycosyltransferase involved in cell wall biosynthesis
MNPGKGGHLVAEWAAQNEPVDVYGYGPFLPMGPGVRNCGPVEQVQLPTVLSKYERFVFLPVALEPFGRCVVEAWASGCQIITNELVGARHWIEQEPGKVETAAEDFWSVVLD